METFNFKLFIIENWDFLVSISSLISIVLIVMLFYLLFTIRNLLIEIAANTRGNRKVVNLKDKASLINEDAPKDWTCPNCKSVNSGTSYKCKSCDYSLT